MRRLSFILAASLCLCAVLPAQIVGRHRKIFTSGGSGPSSFAYVASSVTGCITSFASGITCTAPLKVNPTSGHLLSIILIWANAGTPTVLFACTNNGSATAVGSIQNGSGALAGYSYQQFWMVETSSGADTCHMATSSAEALMAWESAEYSFSGTLSGLDGTPQYSQTTANGSGIATISGLTTTGSSDLIFAGCYLTASSICAVGSGFTFRNDTTACVYNGTSCASTGDFNGNTGSGIEDEVNVAAGAQTATFAGFASSEAVTLSLVGF